MHSGSPLEEGRTERILWLTDLSPSAAACSGAVRWLATLAVARGEEPASVRVVHVLDRGDGGARARALAHCAGLAGDLGSIGLDAAPEVVDGQDSALWEALRGDDGIDLCVVGRGEGRHSAAVGAAELACALGVPVLEVGEPHRLPPWRAAWAERGADGGAACRIAWALAGAGGARPLAEGDLADLLVVPTSGERVPTPANLLVLA
jgi:hypothetical protein